MTSPTPQDEIHKFIDLVYYYHNMWGIWSHIINPLTNIIYNKVWFKYTEVEQKASEETKPDVAGNNLLAYTDLYNN